MNVELNPNIQAGHLPVPADAPDPQEVEGPRSDDAGFEVKDFEPADRLWPSIFPGL